MYIVKSADGQRTKRLTRRQLEELRMVMDWQLKAAGYDPASVAAAFRLAEESDEAVAAATGEAGYCNGCYGQTARGGVPFTCSTCRGAYQSNHPRYVGGSV